MTTVRQDFAALAARCVAVLERILRRVGKQRAHPSGARGSLEHGAAAMSAAEDLTVTLVDGTTLVDLYPGQGGRLGQITLGDRHLLRGPEHSALGWAWWGSYPMLPWVNRIPGGAAEFQVETITVPVNWPDGTAIHGLVAERPWQVENADSHAAALMIEAELDRYHVRSRQTFALDADALDLEIEVVNLAAWPVPAGVGIHPWFVAAPVRVPADLVWPGDGPMPDGLPRPVRPDEDLRQAVSAAPMDRCFTGLTGSNADIGDLHVVVARPDHPGGRLQRSAGLRLHRAADDGDRRLPPRRGRRRGHRRHRSRTRRQPDRRLPPLVAGAVATRRDPGLCCLRAARTGRFTREVSAFTTFPGG